MKLLIYGYPGSGKTTQSKILSETYNLKYISVGDLARNEIFQGTEFGKKVKGYLDKEVYYPKGFLKDLINKQLPDDNFIIDGYPKTENELDDFLEILKKRKIKIDQIVLLENDYGSCKKRVEKRVNCRYCGQPFSREDINSGSTCVCGHKLFFRREDESIFDFRFKDFKNDTMKVINKLAKTTPLTRISGEGSTQEIHDRIKSKINV